MTRFSRKRPSPAMIVAVIALSLALAGSAVAGTNAVVSALSKSKVKKISKKIANKQITKRAPHLSVASAATAGSAGIAATAGEAKKLDGLEANQIVRVAGATAGTTGDPCGPAALFGFESTTFTNVVSRSVTAPVKGLLLVSGDVSSELDSTSPAGAELRLLGRLAVDGKQTGIEAEQTLHELALPCEEGRTMSLDAVQEVAAGTHSVAFQVAKSSISGGTGKAYVGAGSVTALFVPFGNGGAQGVAASVGAQALGGGSNH